MIHCSSIDKVWARCYLEYCDHRTYTKRHVESPNSAVLSTHANQRLRTKVALQGEENLYDMGRTKHPTESRGETLLEVCRYTKMVNSLLLIAFL